MESKWAGEEIKAHDIQLLRIEVLNLLHEGEVIPRHLLFCCLNSQRYAQAGCTELGKLTSRPSEKRPIIPCLGRAGLS